jgi:hypothetical protein
MMDDYRLLASSSIIKEAERINSYLNSFADPLRHLRAQLDSSLHSSAIEAHKRLETTVAGTLQHVYEQYRAAWIEPTQELYKKLESPIKRFQELHTYLESSSIHSAVFEAQQHLETTAAGTLTQIHDQMVAAWAEPMRQAQNIIRKNYLKPHFYAELDSIAERFREFNDLFKNIDFDDITINQDGTISLAEETVTLNDINETVLGLLPKDGEELTLQSFFDILAEKAKSLKGPIKAFILYFLLPYFIGILSTLTSPYYSNIISPESSSNRQVIVKKIKKQTIANFEFTEISSFRFVKADILNVRTKPTIKSEKIDELYLGQVVQIIKKKRNWSFVEYLDASIGEIYSGWVFTRYLERFKK